MFALVCLRLALFVDWGSSIINILRKSRVIIKFCENLADEPGSVVVQEGCWATDVPVSMLGGYLHVFLFH